MKSEYRVEILSKVRKFKINNKELENLVKSILEELKVKGEVEISIAVVSKNVIRELNKHYRNKDKPTNVLSFALDYKKDEYLYGEILICPEVAWTEARKLENIFEHYFVFLIIHGVLHLLGYDHEKEKDRIIMEKTEENLLRQILTKKRRQVIKLCLR